MTFHRERIGLLLLLMVVGLTGCESTSDPSTAEQNLLDTYIGDIPIMPDNFVTSTFELDADGDPVNVDFVELMTE